MSHTGMSTPLGPEFNWPFFTWGTDGLWIRTLFRVCTQYIYEKEKDRKVIRFEWDLTSVTMNMKLIFIDPSGCPRLSNILDS